MRSWSSILTGKRIRPRHITELQLAVDDIDVQLESGSIGLPDQSGHAGEFLTTDGSAPSWDTPAGGGGGDVVVPGWMAGRWYSVQQRHPCGFGNNTGALVANTIYGCPIWVPQGGAAIDRVGAAVQTGVGGSLIRLMAHAPLANGHPGALLFDFGTVSTATSGDKEITVAQTLPAGLVWLTMIPDAAITMLKFDVNDGGILGNSSQAGDAATPLRPTGAFTAPNPFGTTSITYLNDGFPRLAVRAA